MKKHRYQAKNLQRVDWELVAKRVAGQRVVFGVDVAKENFYAAFISSSREVLTTIKWRHPTETPQLGDLLTALPAARIEVVMEPSGTYGDSLRGYLRGLGCEIYHISPKRVHDAAEVYDGVPSLHDAKAAAPLAACIWKVPPASGGRLHNRGENTRRSLPSWIYTKASVAVISIAWTRY
jgi:hypothetical protein